MIAQNEIRQMTFADKVALMETVWTEISSEPEKIEVPQWHKDILDEREQGLASGQVQVLDWEEAKKQIKQATR